MVGQTAIDTASATQNRRDLFTLCAGYALILLVIWTPSPWQRPLYLVAAIFILAASWRAFDSRAAMGLRWTNLLCSLWIAGLALAAATADRSGLLRTAKVKPA
jgi:hypothetical protein